LKKLTLSLISIFTFAILLTGCFSNPIQKDLLSYINDDIAPLASVEDKIFTDYDSVTGQNYKDDPTTFAMLMDTIIPAYNELSDKVLKIQPETPEVRELHDMYIKLTGIQKSAFVGLADAIEKQDIGLVNESNAKLDEANKLARDYQMKLQDMAKEYNIEFKE
jgi:hypothetical protein